MRFKNILRFVVSLFIMAIGFWGCGDDDSNDGSPATQLTISGFSPALGEIGTVVTITGTGFATTGTEVKFNGTAATVTNATATQLTVAVPPASTTGKVTVTANGQTVTSATDFTVLPKVTITSISPASGVAGDEVVITGANFSTTLSAIAVTINGSTAQVKAATSTQITVVVPAEANTGKIAVTSAGASVTSADNFTVLAPTITSFTPGYGAENVSVTITGTNFSTVLAQNIVKFNGVAGTVTAATKTQLTVKMAANSTTGKVSVKVGPNTATSTQDLTICNSTEFIVVKVVFTSVTNNNTCGYKVTVLNAGAMPLDMSHWALQAYACVNADGTGNSQAAGGTTLSYLNKTLQSGETLEFPIESNIIGRGTFATYPYLIMNFYQSSGAEVECNASDDKLVQRIAL